MSILDQLLRASRPLDERGTVPQPRQSAQPVTPAARVIELTRSLESQRVLIQVAAIEIQRLEAEKAEADRGVQREERFHTFGGVSFAGIPVAQHWCDFVAWEAILNENPQMIGIVEIGTWQGGFSRWLHAQTVARRMPVFWTCDAVEPDLIPPGFQRLDVWRYPEVVEVVIGQTEPCVLFCDGGNKPRELKTFPLLLKHPRSLVAVHDWGTETLESDVPDFLEMVYGDFCESMGSITRWFKVRA